MFKPVNFFKTLGTTPFVPQAYSIDFNGTDEFMANTAGQLIGVTDIFSWSMWIKPRTGVFTSNVRLFGKRNKNPVPSDSVFVVDVRGDLPGNPIRIRLWDQVPQLIKDFYYSNVLVQDTWNFITVTWAGESVLGVGTSILTLFHNGSQITQDASPIINGVGTMSDNTSQIIDVAASFAGAQYADCRIFSTGIWNVRLGLSEHTALYNSGNGYSIDWNSNYGNYTSSGSLYHWWLLGNDASSIGKDYAPSTRPPSLIDIGDNASNITSSDRVADYPGI